MESIRMFALCESMKWSHLPVAGGLYDQHPKLLEDFRYIFAKRGEHEAEKERQREAENRKQSRSKGAGRIAGGRRR